MPTESELRLHRACFTGHRPHKLHQPESVVIAALEAKIREAIDDGFVTFISGMAWGVDIWAAEIVLRLKAEGHPLHLIAAVPYEGFERGWDEDWKRRYHDALSKADLVKYVCDHYHRGCFQVRNDDPALCAGLRCINVHIEVTNTGLGFINRYLQSNSIRQ